MSVLFMDGCRHYATAQIAKKYTVLSSTVSTWSIVPEGRFNNALKKQHTGGSFSESGYVQIAPLMTQTGPWSQTPSGVIGFALRVNDLDQIRSPIGNHHIDCVFQLHEGASPVCYVSLNPSGTFSLYVHNRGFTGDGGLLLDTSIQGIRSDVWAYIEMKWLIGDPGAFEIRMNGVTILNYAGYFQPTSWTQPYLGDWTVVTLLNYANAGGNPLNTWLCDLYLLDLEGTGDIKRDFMGDVTIDVIVPEGVGAISNWTPSPAVANWSNVEEIPPDDGLTYINTTAVGTRDSYVMQNVPPGSIPLAFQTLIYCRKETEGGASLAPTYREGGVYYDADSQGIATPDEYRYIIQPYDVNPATGQTITEAEINAAEFGVLKTV